MGMRLFIAVLLLFAFLLLLWNVRRIVTPFLIAMAIAAVLDPMLEKLHHRGMARIWSVVTVYVAFFLMFGIFLTWLVPIIISEAEALAGAWPEYVDGINKLWVTISQHEIFKRIPIVVPGTWAEISDQVGEYVKLQGPKVLQGAISGIFGTVGFFINIIIILISTFYMLKDWPQMRRRVQYIIPPQYRAHIVGVMEKVGAVFIGYLRGQLTLCILYGTTVIIFLLGMSLIPGITVNYPFMLGLTAGILYAVPYLGAYLLTLIVAVVTYTAPGGDLFSAFVVTAVVMTLNNAIFDPILTPRILGRSTGLNPLAALFAIMAGSQMFGLIGFILGVPVAASIAIIASALYPRLGEPIPPDAQLSSAAVASAPASDAKPNEPSMMEETAQESRQLADENSGDTAGGSDSSDG